MLSLHAAGSNWRLKAAAALGINRQDLPESTDGLKCLLLEASTAYPQQLLRAGQAAGYQVPPEDLALLLVAALKTSRPAAVSAILRAVPGTTWMVHALQQPLRLAAQQGNIKAFQLMVEAAVAAEEAAAEATDSSTAFAPDSRGRMETLSSALQCAVKAKKPALIEWVLKQGRPLWTSVLLNPSISAAIAAAEASSLKDLLSSCSVAWPPEELQGYLAPALKHPDRDAKALVLLLLNAAAASGQQWTAAQLARALSLAAWFGKVGALCSLLQQSGVQWICPELLPAIMEVAKGTCGPPFQVEMMQALLGAAADEWAAGELGGVLTATATRAMGGKLDRDVLAAILKHPGITWAVEELVPALEVIAGSCLERTEDETRHNGISVPRYWHVPFRNRHWFREMVADLLAAAEGQWTEQQLAESVTSATREKNLGVVEVLLHQIPSGWRGQHLVDAVELAADGEWYVPPETLEAVLSTLLRAARGRWTAEMLAEALGDAAVNCAATAVEELLELEGVQWTAVSLQCAMVKAAGRDKLEALELMLSVPSLQWQVGQVQAMLAAAAKACSWSCFYRLLQLPVAASLSSAYLQGLVDWIVGPSVEYLHCSDSPLSSSDSERSGRTRRPRSGNPTAVKPRCAVLLKVLSHPNHGGVMGLTGALTVAAATGDKDLLAQLLEQRGLQWTKEQLLPAVRAAVRGCQWEVMEQLLAVPEGGWSSKELLPLLQGAIKSAHSAGVRELLRIPGSLLVGGWSVDNKLSAVVHTLPHTLYSAEVWQCVGQVLAASLNAGWSAKELQETLTAAAKSDAPPVGVVQQLLALPSAAWRATHMLEAATEAARRNSHWDMLKLLLRVPGAQWTGEQLGRVMQKVVPAGLYFYIYGLIGRGQAQVNAKKLVSEILTVPGIEWKAVHLAATAAAAAGNGEGWCVLEVLLVVKGVGWTREQLLPVMKSVVKAAGWVEQLPLVLCAGEDVQWEAQDLVVALHKAGAAEKWGLAEQLVAAGSTAVWDVLQLAEVLEVAARQEQVGLVERLLAAPSVGWTVAVLWAAMEAAVEKQKWQVLQQLLVAAGRVQGWGLEDLRDVMLAVVEAGQEQLVQMVLGVAAASGDVTWQEEDLEVLVAAAQSRGHWGTLAELAGGGGGAVAWTQEQVLELLKAASYEGVIWLVGMLLDWTQSWLTRGHLAMAVTAAACTGSGSSSVLQLLLQQTQGWSLDELQTALTVAAQRGDVGALEMLVSAMGWTLTGIHWQPGPAAGMMG